MSLKGVVADNRGVDALLYSLDGAAPVEVPCSGYFQLFINDIPEGTHNLEVWARNNIGISGSKVLVKGVTMTGKAPQSKITFVRSTVNRTVTSAEFYSGI